MTDLASAVVSITTTARGRFFWAAWWTGAPTHAPFRKPDASHGGARTWHEALAEAERTTGRALTVIDGYWARAFNRTLRGQPPPPPPGARRTSPARDAPDAHAEKARPLSSWQILGVEKGATLAEIKRAYKRRALALHPDQGGDADAFRALTRAYEKLAARAPKAR